MSVNKFRKGLSADEKAEIQEKFTEVKKLINLITHSNIICMSHISLLLYAIHDGFQDKEGSE